MLSLVNRVRALHLFYQLVKDPNRTDLIFKGVDIVSSDKDQSVVNKLVDKILAHEEFRQQYESRYMPETPKLEDLAQMPEGSFGQAVYQHMKANNLDFDLFPKLRGDSIVEYISVRIYQDHDLWHVLMGYGTKVEDELGLQGFGVAQYNSPVGVALIAGGFLHLLKRDPMEAVAALKKVNDGYNVGKNAKFMLNIKLHDLFARPLEEVRALCGVTVH